MEDEKKCTISLTDEEIHILLCALMVIQSYPQFEDSRITIFGLSSSLSLASYKRFILSQK